MDLTKNRGNTASRNPKSGQNNSSFARALAESEKRSTGNNNKSSLLDKALNRSGSSFSNVDQESLWQQQAELKEEKKKKELRERLHRKVNPVEQTDVFDARKEQVQKEIEDIRKELKSLAKEVSKFYKEVDITIEQNVADPGMQGTYHINFFQKLKQFIILLRQKVHSARTWARQMKAKRKKRSVRQGLDFGSNEAKATHDMLHHERSNAYTGA